MLNLLSVSGASYPGIDVTIFKFNVPSILQINTTAPPSTVNKLPIPWHDLQENPSDLSLLSWHTRISEFSGYDDHRTELERWAALPQPAISVKFITGLGGIGKSRLAAEFAQMLSDNEWSAGFVNLRDPGSYPLSEHGTLLIIDYPEEYKPKVKELLLDLSTLGNTCRLRVLFLSRQTLDQWEDLISESNAGNLVDWIPVNLEAIDSLTAHKIYNSALEKLSKHHGSCPPPLSEEQISEWLKLASENDRPLFVIAAALFSALNPDEEVVKYTGRQIVDAIAKREIERLMRQAANCDAVDHYLFARWFAMAAIADKIPLSKVEQLHNESDLPLQFPSNVDIQSVLQTSGIFEKGAIPAPKPDIVAAAFTVKVLSQRLEIAHELIWTALEGNVIENLERITRLCYDSELTLEMRDDTISAWLVVALKGDVERCTAASDFFTTEPPVCLEKPAVVVWETLRNVARDDEEKALMLNNLSVFYSADGDTKRALEAIQEAVEIYRGLSAANPTRYQLNLATSLNNLSTELSDAGDNPRALEAIRESVEIYRGLSAANPARYQPDLAMSLHNLSHMLSDVGDNQGALEAIQEAMEIYRGLSVVKPTIYQPYLAGSLNSLSNRLSAAGDNLRALEAIQEAVEIYRGLSATNPARYQPDLALSLNNLSSELSAAGDTPGALEAIQEAVEIYRRLSAVNPARYQPDLASSLNNLSVMLGAVGDNPGALKAVQEAVEIRRGLSVVNPARYQPDLAMSLNNLSTELSAAGDNPGALQAIQEAVEIRRGLASVNPARYQPDLAMSLNNLSNSLSGAGDNPGALQAIQEAVEIRRGLSAVNPARYQPDLASSLNNLSTELSGAGDNPGALQAIQEAVEIYRGLVVANPARYKPELARSLGVLGLVHLIMEQFSESAHTCEEGIKLLEPIVKKYPKSPHSDLLVTLNSILKLAQERME